MYKQNFSDTLLNSYLRGTKIVPGKPLTLLGELEKEPILRFTANFKYRPVLFKMWSLH